MAFIPFATKKLTIRAVVIQSIRAALCCAIAIFSIAAFAAEPVQPLQSQQPASDQQQHHLDIYKAETCGCCTGWISHLEANHFSASIHHPEDLNQKKKDLGIEARYQSCHTAVSKEGYFFEGHIPAHSMQKFLAEKPDQALGLAVPGMPIGSPGMEMGDRHDDYDVLLINRDGSSEVYEHISK